MILQSECAPPVAGFSSRLKVKAINCPRVTYRFCQCQNGFPCEVRFFSIILDFDVDDMYRSVVLTAPIQ